MVHEVHRDQDGPAIRYWCASKLCYGDEIVQHPWIHPDVWTHRRARFLAAHPGRVIDETAAS